MRKKSEQIMMSCGGKRNIFLAAFALALCANLSIVQHFQLQRENLELKRRLDSLTGWNSGSSQGTVDYHQSYNNALPVRRSEVSASTLQESLIALWKQLLLQTGPGKTRQLVLSHWRRREVSDLGENDIVLITHGSIAKLEILLTELKFWNGPCSVALYLNDGLKQINRLADFVANHEEELRQTSIHLFFEYTAPSRSSSKPNKLAYPHNPLRNLAMDNSDSDYVVALDMDFVPGPPNCYDRLMKALSANDNALATEMRKNHRILVLPAFEVYAQEGELVATRDLLPASKADLMELVESDRAETFRVKRFPEGHGPTNFTKWFEYPEQTTGGTAEEKDPLFYPISYRPGFEPYVLAYRPGIPKYWDTYRGYGLNKMSWFMELHRAGYRFGVLTQEYVVHLEHPSTTSGSELRLNFEKTLPYLDYLDYRYPIVENRQFTDRGLYFSFRRPDGTYMHHSEWHERAEQLRLRVAQKLAQRDNASINDHSTESELPSQLRSADYSHSRASLLQAEIRSESSSQGTSLNATVIDAMATGNGSAVTRSLLEDTATRAESSVETSSRLRGGRS